MNYFSSDFHHGHKVIVDKYRTQFSSTEEHDNFILDQVAALKKRDILYILGDFIFDSDKYEWYIEQYKKMACRIKLVMGNHDSMCLYKEDIFEIQLPLFSYKNVWVSHCPIHPQELRNRYGNIHGHLHKDIIWQEDDITSDLYEDKRYFNVCPDRNDFKLVSYDKIMDRFK